MWNIYHTRHRKRPSRMNVLSPRKWTMWVIWGKWSRNIDRSMHLILCIILLSFFLTGSESHKLLSILKFPTSGNNMVGPDLRWHDVPEDARRPFIHTSYRPTSSGILYSLRSAFRLHNETGNVWTHALPILYFLYFLLFDQDWLRWLHTKPEQSVILVNYFFGILILFIASSCAHLLNCAGEHCWRNACFGFDYAAITVFGTSSALVYFFLLRPAHEGLLCGTRDFLTIIFMAGVLAMAACCWSMLRPALFLNILRVVAFAVPFFVGSTPAFRRLSSHGISNNITAAYKSNVIAEMHHSSEDSPDFLFGVRYSRHLMLMIAGGLINASHIPERFWPGKFDIYGHSHQLFHLCIFLAIREQFWMILGDISHVASQPRIQETFTASSPQLTVVTMAALVASLVGILIVFVILSLTSNKTPCCDDKVASKKLKCNW